MENKRYFFHPTGKMNQDYSMDDENKTPVYEAKVLKKGIFSAWQFEFTDHQTNKSEVHKVGHTVTTEQHSGAMDLLGGVTAAVADMPVGVDVEEKTMEFSQEETALVRLYVEF